jgi:hypothetical protein
MSNNIDVKKKGRKPKSETTKSVAKQTKKKEEPKKQVVIQQTNTQPQIINMIPEEPDEEENEDDMLDKLSEDDYADSLVAKTEILRGMNINKNKLPDELVFSYVDQLIRLRLHKMQKQTINSHVWEDIFGAIQLIRVQKDFYKIFLLVLTLNVVDKPSNRYLYDILKFFIYVCRSITQEFADSLPRQLHYFDHITQVMFLLNKFFGKFFMIELFKQRMVADDDTRKINKYRRFNYIEKLTLDVVQMVNKKEEAFNKFKEEYMEDYADIHKNYPEILERVEALTKNDMCILEFSYCCEYIPYAMDIVLRTVCKS